MSPFGDLPTGRYDRRPAVEAWVETTHEAPAVVDSVLVEAAKIVDDGEREQTYGHPRHNFRMIANLWTALFPGHVFTPNDVALAMIAVKLARQTGGFHLDSMIDVAGYARCAQRIAEAS